MTKSQSAISERQDHLDETHTIRFLSLRDVLNKTSISRSHLYHLIKDPELPFPAPVHLGRRSVWIEGEVESYMHAVIENEREATS